MTILSVRSRNRSFQGKFYLFISSDKIENMLGQIKRLGSPGPSQKIYRVPNIPLLRGDVLPGAPTPLGIQLKYKVLSINTLKCKYVQNINQSEANDCMHMYVSLVNPKYIPGIGTVISISFPIRITLLYSFQSFCSWRQIKNESCRTRRKR